MNGLNRLYLPKVPAKSEAMIRPAGRYWEPVSHPAIGKQARLEQLEEYWVEMVCADEHIKKVVETLLKEHPYEQPAWQVCRVLALEEL